MARCGFRTEIARPHTYSRHTACKAADVAGYRHFVFIDYYDQAQSFCVFAVIKRFLYQPSGKCTVTNDCNGICTATHHSLRPRYSQRGRQGCRAVSRPERIMLAFRPFCKAGNSAGRAQSVKSFTPACQQLMNVALMPHIPYNMVARTVKYAV